MDKIVQTLLETFLFETYEDALGIYKEESDNKTFFAYLYQKEKGGKWYSSENDQSYFSFDPHEHLYKLLSDGYRIFYMSENLHRECWKQACLTIDLNDEFIHKYYHGLCIYFQYCEEHNLNFRFQDGEKEADELFSEFNEKLTTIIAKTLNASKLLDLDPLTYSAYEYMLHEPCYKNLSPMYTLLDKTDKNAVSFFQYDDYCVIQYFHANNDSETPELLDLSDWAFNYDECFLSYLQDGYEIKYISRASHNDMLYELTENDHDDYKEGLKQYLKYCAKKNIYKHLPDDCKEEILKQCQSFNIKLKTVSERSER